MDPSNSIAMNRPYKYALLLIITSLIWLSSSSQSLVLKNDYHRYKWIDKDQIIYIQTIGESEKSIKSSFRIIDEKSILYNERKIPLTDISKISYVTKERKIFGYIYIVGGAWAFIAGVDCAKNNCGSLVNPGGGFGIAVGSALMIFGVKNLTAPKRYDLQKKWSLQIQKE